MARINWDFMGIVTSVACAVHCAILPLIITSLPVFGINIIHNLFFEWIMIAIAFIVGCYALIHGYLKHHKSLLPLLIFSGGFLFLILKQAFNSYEFLFLAPAVSLILYAHFSNYKLWSQARISGTDSES